MLTTLVASPAASVGILLLSCAYLWPHFPVAESSTILFVALLVSASLLFRLPKRETKLEQAYLTLASKAYLGVGSVLCLFYALFGQATGMVVDGDFFVHVSSIGLFQEGHYPPRNPFLGLPTHGHFGRQILIASLSELSGFAFLETEWVYTCCIQVLSFIFLFCLIWKVTHSQLQAALGSGFGFYGASLGGSVGIADTVSNHNPTAVLFLILGSWVLFRVIEPTIGDGSGKRSFGALFLGGVLLGIDSLVYEIHYALMLLSIPILLLSCQVNRAIVKRIFCVVLLSLVVALSSGGVLTDMAARIVGLKSEPAVESAAQQRVKISIPKEKLFQVRLDNLRPSRPFEGKWRPWKANFAEKRGYDFVWSRAVMNVFWYPSWTFPLVLLTFLWKRHAMGLWFSSLALGALVTPAIIDFGFFEGEILRWLFVFSASSSIGFGLALGVWMQSLATRWAKVLLLMIALLVSTVALRISLSDTCYAVSNPGTPLPIGRPGIVPGVGLIPRPFKLLEHHFGLTDEDFEVAKWIRDKSPSSALVLADDLGLQVNARAAMIGLEGRFPAGYEQPVGQTSDPSGYPRTQAVVAFWESGEVTHLDSVEFDLLVIHTDRQTDLFLQTFALNTSLKESYRIGKLAVYSKI